MVGLDSRMEIKETHPQILTGSKLATSPSCLVPLGKRSLALPRE